MPSFEDEQRTEDWESAKVDNDDCKDCYGTGDNYRPLPPDGARLVREDCRACRGTGRVAQTSGQ